MQLSIFNDDEPIAEPGADHAQIARYALAAEHLVCAHLLTEGLDAFLVTSARPYDILVDAGGLFRLQVKSRLHKKAAGKFYPTHYRFGNAYSNGRQRDQGLVAYQGKVEAFAFVALDIRRIIYLHIGAITTKSVTFSERDFVTKETASLNALKSLLNPKTTSAPLS